MRLQLPCRARYIGPTDATNPSLLQQGEVVTVVRQGSTGWYDESYGLIRRDVRPWTSGRKPRDRWMCLDWFELLEDVAGTGTDG